MKITCAQENIARGLAAVKSAVASKSTLPILTHVLLDARADVGDGRMRIVATDLALCVMSFVPAKVDDPGAITVPARVIAEFVSTLPQEQVEMQLDTESQTLKLRCGRMSANIKGTAANEFPEMPTLPADSIQVALEAKGLKEMLERVVLSAATDESRPVLTGVFAKFDQRHLTLGAADGFRLSIQHTGIHDPIDAFNLIIPVKAIEEVGRLCANQPEPVKLLVSPAKTQVRFRFTNGEVVSRLIEGSYPDLARVVPQTHTSRAVVNVSELLGAAKMVSAFVERNGKTNGIRLEADPANSRILVMGAHAERGDGIGDVDSAIEGPPFKLAVQATYLLALLERLSVPQLAIEYHQEGGQPMPVVIRPVGDESFIHVIMPLADVTPRSASPAEPA